MEEVKSKPAKAAAKPTKKPVLPDSVKAIQKVSKLATQQALLPGKAGCQVRFMTSR